MSYDASLLRGGLFRDRAETNKESEIMRRVGITLFPSSLSAPISPFPFFSHFRLRLFVCQGSVNKSVFDLLYFSSSCKRSTSFLGGLSPGPLNTRSISVSFISKFPAFARDAQQQLLLRLSPFHFNPSIQLFAHLNLLDSGTVEPMP